MVFPRSFWILQCCIFRRKIHLSWWSYSRWPLMSDPRNVGCLQARKSLVKLSKARFPNRGRRQRMESHYLTKETKQQTQNWDNNSKIICHALLRLLLRHPQNTTFCGSKMTICATAAAQTDTQKTFLFEKKSFSFDFLYCYVRVVQNSKNGAKSIIAPIGILELGLAEKYEHW